MALSGRIARFWDAAAASFGAEPDHGLLDPAVRAAWARRLEAWLPPPPADVLEPGCGTGSLALLAARAGHRVLGVDLAPRMVERARAKLGTAAAVLAGDAGDPPVGARTFDAVLVRHLVWTLPDPHAALHRWVSLLRSGGRLVLVEGRWDAGGSPPPYVAGAERLPWAGGVGAAALAAAVGAAGRPPPGGAAGRPRALGPPRRGRALRAGRRSPGGVLACRGRTIVCLETGRARNPRPHEPVQTDAADPPLRGAGRRALPRREDARPRPPLHR